MSAIGKTFEYADDTWVVVDMTSDAFICRPADGLPGAFRFTFEEVREALLCQSMTPTT